MQESWSCHDGWVRSTRSPSKRFYDTSESKDHCRASYQSSPLYSIMDGQLPHNVEAMVLPQRLEAWSSQSRYRGSQRRSPLFSGSFPYLLESWMELFLKEGLELNVSRQSLPHYIAGWMLSYKQGQRVGLQI